MTPTAYAIRYDGVMRWWLIGLVSICVGSLTAACSKDNPGWLESASESSATVSTTSTTLAETTTQTATTMTTMTTSDGSTTAGQATGDPLACPDDSLNYCPFIIDLADAPDENSCTNDAYSAYRDMTSFFRCDGACDADSCQELVVEMPGFYSVFTEGLGPCLQIEHEQRWIDNVCRTRALAIWSAQDDTATVAPQIILAAHDPQPPTSLPDLQVEFEDSRVLCDCGTCNLDYAIDPGHWCCDGQLSLGAFKVTNDVGTVYRATYRPLLKPLTIEYRGEEYKFVITQSHDGATDCQGDLTPKSGWYMQRT